MSILVAIGFVKKYPLFCHQSDSKI